MEVTVLLDPEIWDMEGGLEGGSSERGLKGQGNIGKRRRLLVS